MKRNYIGLASSFHDGALAIVDSNGETLFAEATERSLQSKRSLCICPDLMQRTGEVVAERCEPDAEIVVAHTWANKPAHSADFVARHLARKRADVGCVDGSVPALMRAEVAASEHAAMAHWMMTSFSGENLKYELSRIGRLCGKPPVVRRYDHHLTHAVAACHSSGYDHAVCAVVDGLGEHTSCAFFEYRDGQLVPIIPRCQGSGSLGSFYQDMCVACGFGELTGEEWKVMGLACYGRPDDELIALCRRAIRAERLTLYCEDSLDLRAALAGRSRRGDQPSMAAADLACAAQFVFEETLVALLRDLHERMPSPNLVLGGGCALNSSANGKILALTPFESLYVFCAPGDDGNAVGAARQAFLDDHPGFRYPRAYETPYLGSSMAPETLANVLRYAGGRRRKLPHEEVPKAAARLLADGKIVGWIQGRAEFGPRALGNRSILADPRSATIKDEINARVKFREEFRPFAPSILHEFGPEYFESYQQSPYMERTLKFREEVRARVPGVVHVDGTGRLQTVKQEWNPRYHALIGEFHRLTGVPLVLNTSFNVMGKPISHSVEDVIAVFHSTGLDAVLVEDVLLEK